ncbi:MAG: phosphatidylglycerophosphatase A [Pseudobdellovibrionaceae bacterium]|nr:phosphatidylglycerophosphatase A [Pseudobdellovibrionaceae bacterium]
MQNIKEKFLTKYETVKENRSLFVSRLNITSPEFQIATWFGSGLIIPAPGTWGTVGGALFGIALMFFTSSFATVLVAVALTVIGYWAIRKIEHITQDHDSSFIVIDEVIAILLVFALMPEFSTLMTLSGFVIFRFFDAAKPWPINWLDRQIGGAAGVIVDDLMAALYTLLILWGYYGFI